ncbi:hypothetical protein GMRT_10346 [Giardia muris]|uniref:Uncharacterized protein n=1 Tax=Giardia muris TaxID=5742 RepID=A0A4Z1T0L0_GIAMU|nr:hypothetical protein GMRT_10346 [Giardia muris]|eukprot:TNJ26447.1 hypothetical protein GMRT_10346 [Giardia muris]
MLWEQRLRALEDAYESLSKLAQTDTFQAKIRSKISDIFHALLEFIPCIRISSRGLAYLTLEQRGAYDSAVRELGVLLTGYVEQFLVIKYCATLCAKILAPYQCAELIRPDLMREIFRSYGDGYVTDVDILSYCQIVVLGAEAVRFDSVVSDPSDTRDSQEREEKRDANLLNAPLENILDPHNSYYNERRASANTLLLTLTVFKTELSSPYLLLSNECFLLLSAAEMIAKLASLPPAQEEDVYEALCSRATELMAKMYNNVWTRIAASGEDLTEVWNTRRDYADFDESLLAHAIKNDSSFHVDITACSSSSEDLSTHDLDPKESKLVNNGDSISHSTTASYLSPRLDGTTLLRALIPEVEVPSYSVRSTTENLAATHVDWHSLGTSSDVYRNKPDTPENIPVKHGKDGLVLSRSTQEIGVLDISSMHPGILQAQIRDPRTFSAVNRRDTLKMVTNADMEEDSVLIILCSVASTLLESMKKHQVTAAQGAFENTKQQPVSLGPRASSSSKGILRKSGGESSPYGRIREGYHAVCVPETLRILSHITPKQTSSSNHSTRELSGSRLGLSTSGGPRTQRPRARPRTQELGAWLATMQRIYYYSLTTSFDSWSFVRHALLCLLHVRARIIRRLYNISSIESACYAQLDDTSIQDILNGTFVGIALKEFLRYIEYLGQVTIQEIVSFERSSGLDLQSPSMGSGRPRAEKLLGRDDAVLSLRVWASQVGAHLVYGGSDIGPTPCIKNIREHLLLIQGNQDWNRFEADELCHVVVILCIFGSVIFQGEETTSLLPILITLSGSLTSATPQLLQATKKHLGDLYLYLSCPIDLQDACYRLYSLSA